MKCDIIKPIVYIKLSIYNYQTGYPPMHVRAREVVVQQTNRTYQHDRPDTAS